MLETIPIPHEQAQNKEPIYLEVNHLDAWPEQRFEIRLDWNNAMEQWIFEMEHMGGYGNLFPRSPAHLERIYSFDEYIIVGFYDPSGEAEQVLPQNLGDNVMLVAFPGTKSPGFATYEG